MAGPDVQVERHALLRSMAVTGVLGVLGIGWGYLTGSQMILLDGVYALVGIVVSWMLLHASGLAQAEPSPRYPFGREAVTPLVIGVQGFVLLATLLDAAVGAVNALLDGGDDGRARACGRVRRRHDPGIGDRVAMAAAAK